MGKPDPVQAVDAARRQHDAGRHERVKIAVESDGPIEAVTLCEKRMADRLHSHLDWRVVEARLLNPAHLPDPLRRRLVFDRPLTLASAARLLALEFDSPSLSQADALPTRIPSWPRKCSRAAKGPGVTLPTQTTFAEDERQYFARLATPSAHGKQLVSQVWSWNRAYRRRQQMATRPSSGNPRDRHTSPRPV